MVGAEKPRSRHAWRFFAPPSFTDEEQQRVARLLHTILVSGLLVCVFVGVVHLWLLDGVGTTIYLYPSILGLGFTLLILLRFVRPWLVGVALVAMLWLAIVASAATDGGLHGPAIGGLVLVVIVATLLFSRRLVVGFIVICLLTFVGFLALDWTDLLPPPTTPDLPELAFLARAIHLIGAGTFLYLAVHHLQAARARARAGEDQAAARLRDTVAARRYADNIVASMAESLIVIASDGTIQTINKAATELLGYTREELIGQPLRRLLPDFGSQAADHSAAQDQSERLLRSKNGRIVPVLMTRSALFDDNHPTPIGSVCVASDISQLKQAEARLLDTTKQAEEASLAKSRFLANMSHELRTPLNAVIGYAELLLEEAEDRRLGNTTEEVQKILLAGKHLLGLIADILDLSKVEAGRMDIHMETFDVADMVSTVVDTVQPQVQRNGNTLIVHCPPEIGFVYSDLTKIRQILLNLLSNAAKFTDHGSIRLNVSRSITGGPKLHFAVADTGIGMTQGQLSQLFQAFSQADSSTSRRYGGTGLGLAISKAFVDMLGGTIEVQSKLGAGTVFTIRVPFVDPMELSLHSRTKVLPDLPAPHLR